MESDDVTTPVPHADRDHSEEPVSGETWPEEYDNQGNIKDGVRGPFALEEGDTGAAILPPYWPPAHRYNLEHGRKPCPVPGEHEELVWFRAEMERLKAAQDSLLRKLDEARAETGRAGAEVLRKEAYFVETLRLSKGPDVAVYLRERADEMEWRC